MLEKISHAEGTAKRVACWIGIKALEAGACS